MLTVKMEAKWDRKVGKALANKCYISGRKPPFSCCKRKLTAKEDSVCETPRFYLVNDVKKIHHPASPHRTQQKERK